VVLEGRLSTPSRPVRISVHLHPYGDRRTLLLSRDVTALEQADAMRRDFVANVSHEIRTPLTVLTGFVETLQTLPLSADERSRYLGMMAQQAQRMQSVVQDLLTLSRLEGSPLPGMAEWTPVQSLMQRCEEEGRALSALLTQNQQRPHAMRFPAADRLRSPKARLRVCLPNCKAPCPTSSTTRCATRPAVVPSRCSGCARRTAVPCSPCTTPAPASRPSTSRA